MGCIMDFRKKSSDVLQNVFVLSISVVFSMMLGELCLRVFRPAPIIPRYVTDAPYGIRMNYPNINIWHTTPDYKINIRANSRGIRADREINYTKPTGKKRILALGDSFTMGFGVDLEDLYLTKLEERLNKKGYNVEVINFGIGGFSTAEELIYLQSEGFKYNYDLLILAFSQNDLRDNKLSDLYSVTDNKLIRKNEKYLPGIKLRNFLYSFGIYRYLAENSQLLNLIRESVSSAVRKYMLNNNKQYSSRDEFLENKQILSAKIIDRMFEYTNKGDIPFLLLNIPSPDLTTDIPIEKLEHFNKMFFFDSADFLRKIPAHIDLYWKRSRNHWTPYSHNLVAERLADFIIEYKLITNKNLK